jgi:hypothetical protein
VPLDVSTAYGLIFVQCTQAAVAGGLQAPQAAPAVPVPTLAPTLAPTPAPQTLPVFGSAYSIDVDAAPGQWARGALNTPGGGQLVQAVRNEAARRLALSCVGPRPTLFVGPFEAGVPTQGVQIVVLGRGGIDGRIFQQGDMVQGVYGNYLAINANTPQLIDTLRKGNAVELRFDTAGTERFGLSGSSRAIAEARCNISAAPRWIYSLQDVMRHDPWQLRQAMHRNGPAPALILPTAFTLVPPLALTCDKRFSAQGAQVASYEGRLQGEVALRRNGADLARFPVAFEAQPGETLSDILSEGQLAAMTEADEMELVFDVNAPPGGFVTVATTMAGFAEGVPQLVCPAPPGAPLLGGGRDLTGAADWQVERVTSFTDMPYYSANYIVPGAPKLFVTCSGVPSVLEGFCAAEPGPQLNLRLTVDEDPARTVESMFQYYRGGPANMGPEFRIVRPWILAGETLRITNLDDETQSFLYPLAGLREAIATMPGPCLE